ncbi:hypothetical protein KKB55_00450, partial [Myxococcota bacterium]|nr:hypothetical protein [Myxococcota bacterium]
MIVELCGPPGVGKSTLARAWVAALRAEGRAIHALPSPWWRARGPLIKLQRGLHLAALVAAA